MSMNVIAASLRSALAKWDERCTQCRRLNRLGPLPLARSLLPDRFHGLAIRRSTSSSTDQTLGPPRVTPNTQSTLPRLRRNGPMYVTCRCWVSQIRRARGFSIRRAGIRLSLERFPTDGKEERERKETGIFLFGPARSPQCPDALARSLPPDPQVAVNLL